MWAARTDSDMFQRFTPRARQAIAAAPAHAQRLGSADVRPEHLVLGAASADERIARLLETNSADLQLPDQMPPEPVAEGHEFAPATKSALQAALDETLRRGQAWIEPAHLLLGVLSIPEGRAIVAQLGVSEGDLRAALETEIASIPFAIAIEQASQSAAAIANGRGQQPDGGHLLEALSTTDPLVRMALEEELGVTPQRLAMAIDRLRTKQRDAPAD